MSFDDPNLVAKAGLLLTATIAERLGMEALIDATVRLGEAHRWSPSRSQGDDLDARDDRWRRAHRSCQHGARRIGRKRARSSGDGPSTLGTFLRYADVGITCGRSHSVASASSKRSTDLVIDIDSKICEVVGKAKRGAGYG